MRLIEKEFLQEKIFSRLDMGSMFQEFYNKIKHGDKEHQRWLLQEMLDFIGNKLDIIDMEKRDEVVERVRQKLLDRSQVGIKKYSTTLAENNKDNYLNHVQMELLDACNYIEKKLMQGEDLIQLIKLYPNDQKLGTVIRKIYG